MSERGERRARCGDQVRRCLLERSIQEHTRCIHDMDHGNLGRVTSNRCYLRAAHEFVHVRADDGLDDGASAEYGLLPILPSFIVEIREYRVSRDRIYRHICGLVFRSHVELSACADKTEAVQLSRTLQEDAAERES